MHGTQRRYAWKALARFPLFHRRGYYEFLTESAEERTRTKEQSNGVPENLRCNEVVIDRSPYQDRHARIIIMARKCVSTKRPDTFAQTVLRLTNLPLQSGGGPYNHTNHGAVQLQLSAADSEHMLTHAHS